MGPFTTAGSSCPFATSTGAATYVLLASPLVRLTAVGGGTPFVWSDKCTGNLGCWLSSMSSKYLLVPGGVILNAFIFRDFASWYDGGPTSLPTAVMAVWEWYGWAGLNSAVFVRGVGAKWWYVVFGAGGSSCKDELAELSGGTNASKYGRRSPPMLWLWWTPSKGGNSRSCWGRPPIAVPGNWFERWGCSWGVFENVSCSIFVAVLYVGGGWYVGGVICADDAAAAPEALYTGLLVTVIGEANEICWKTASTGDGIALRFSSVLMKPCRSGGHSDLVDGWRSEVDRITSVDDVGPERGETRLLLRIGVTAFWCTVGATGCRCDGMSLLNIWLITSLRSAPGGRWSDLALIEVLPGVDMELTVGRVVFTKLTSGRGCETVGGSCFRIGCGGNRPTFPPLVSIIDPSVDDIPEDRVKLPLLTAGMWRRLGCAGVEGYGDGIKLGCCCGRRCNSDSMPDDTSA